MLRGRHHLYIEKVVKMVVANVSENNYKLTFKVSELKVMI